MSKVSHVPPVRWHLPAHYPLYLLLICAGYLLVFAVERVAFEVSEVQCSSLSSQGGFRSSYSLHSVAVISTFS